MNKHNILLGAAIAGLMAAGTTLGQTAQAKEIKCVGGNSCKGNSACKTAKNSCKGQNACKGTGMAMAKSKADCATMKADAAKPADAPTEKKDEPKS